MKEVSQSVLFRIGPPTSEDGTKPSAVPEFGGSCPVDANDTAVCNSYQWHVEFHVKVRILPQYMCKDNLARRCSLSGRGERPSICGGEGLWEASPDLSR